MKIYVVRGYWGPNWDRENENVVAYFSKEKAEKRAEMEALNDEKTLFEVEELELLE